MSVILVTGGCGAVGVPLVEELRRRGNEVWVVDLAHAEGPNYIRCDVGQHRELERALDAAKFDLVYHLGAEFGRWNGEHHYERLWQSNVIGTKHMLRLQEERGFRMIFASSSEVYGDYDGLMTEDVMMEHAIRQMNDYAISKWVSELQIMNSRDRFGTETVRVRLFNTYGPGERFSEYRSVVCQFVYKALHDTPYTVYLNHHRTSTYIDDCVRTLANINERFKPGEVYNIAGDEYHDIKTLSDIILKQLGKSDKLVKYIETEAHNTRDKKTDPARAKKDLGHENTMRLEEGIRRTIAWQKELYGVK